MQPNPSTAMTFFSSIADAILEFYIAIRVEIELKKFEREAEILARYTR